jgi:hypothetical protein
MPKRLTANAPAALDDLSEQDVSAYETLAAVLESLGDSDAVIRISRARKTGGFEFCEQLPADPSFSPQYIKDNWGGGVYSVQLWGPKPGQTGTKYLKSVTVKVAGAPKEKKEPEPEAPAARGFGADPSVVQLQLELATLKGMLAGMQTAKAGESGNPLDNLEKLTTVMKNLMPAAPALPGANPSEMLAFVREAMELGKTAAGGSGDGEGTPWGLIVEKAVEPAIGLIGQALAAQKAGGLPAVETAPVVAANPSAPALAPGAPMWQAELAKIVPRLLKRAREGKDPELAAALFLEDAPGGVVMQLEELAKDGGFVTTTLALAEQYFPEVKEVRGWVEMFLKAVQENLVEEEEPAPTAGPALTVEVTEKQKRKKGSGGEAIP